MRTEATSSVQPNRKVSDGPSVVLSRWINERCPPLIEILSAHDVARLTRRPCWLLFGLSLIGRFPRKMRYRGRPVGWCRTEVLEWMTRDLKIVPEIPERHFVRRHRVRQHPRQVCLPLKCRQPCGAERSAREAGR